MDRKQSLMRVIQQIYMQNAYYKHYIEIFKVYIYICYSVSLKYLV